MVTINVWLKRRPDFPLSVDYKVDAYQRREFVVQVIHDPSNTILTAETDDRELFNSIVSLLNNETVGEYLWNLMMK